MKFLNKGQTIFTSICMLALAFLVANFFAYYLHGIPIKEIINNWDFFKILEIVLEDHVPPSVKQQGYTSLLIGFGVSLILPLLSLIAINRIPKKAYMGMLNLQL